MNVYDFDNTIYDGETLVDIVAFFAKCDPKVLRYIPKLLVLWGKEVFHFFTIEEALGAFSGFLEGYFVTITDMDKQIVEFWNKNEKKIKPFYNEIRRDDDVIVSGTTDFILEEIAKRIGIKNYICSSIDSKTGKFIRLCYRENKVEAFYERFPGAHIENFYTDSMNDKPMMEISDHVFIVKKNKITQIK